MRRRYVSVIVDALGILQHGCRGHLFKREKKNDDGHTPVNSDKVLSDEDLPAAAGSDDRRQVFPDS